MSRFSPRAILVSLLGFAAVVISLFAAPGCTTWRTKKYGDAKLRRENYHFRSVRIGVMPPSRDLLSFPQVALDAPVTNVFHVRNFPTNRAPYELVLELPKKYPAPVERNNAPLPWHHARIRIIARALNGHELFARRTALDHLPRWDSEKRDYDLKGKRRRWNDSWPIRDLAEVLRDKPDYDLIVIVELPSKEKGNLLRVLGNGANW